MRSNRKKFWLKLTFYATAIALAATLLSLRSPMAWRLPSCPLRSTTGLYCPGCGSTRAIWRLIHGDVLGATRYNPLTLPTLLYVAYYETLTFYELWTGRSCNRRLTLRLAYVLLALFIASFVLRNIPCEFLDVLRPPQVS